MQDKNDIQNKGKKNTLFYCHDGTGQPLGSYSLKLLTIQNYNTI